ncbi:MAG: hypothetical protein GF383_00080 [Candidatus Lokiarchaeota archaeon]|nr:hypothetical protein [Candidatus Lokiarchaeota archaeon]
MEDVDKLLSSNQISCWNNKYSINAKLFYLLSNIETIEGCEVDLFELMENN